MAISMGSYSIDNAKRDEVDSLSYTSIDSSISTRGTKDFAGISSNFVSAFDTAIGSYISSVNDAVDSLNALDSNGAINGTAVEGAIKEFIKSVKDVCIDWVNALKTAEQNIVTSVEEAYKQQDTSLSGDLGSDQSTVTGNKIG